ncbi:alpha/beta fold hydrolase [Streptomyces sp. NBC_00365]|uniref:alpha/beta hydrolase n=1 Tax=Streptomyces sp. NBC_00365 TaxID=2975726 RepID=UPI00338FA8E0
MPVLARDFTVVAVDQRGIGLTDKPQDGYDTRTIANDLVALMGALGHQRFAVAGTDTGMPIGYALAAGHPDRVAYVALAEVPGPPGNGSLTAPVPRWFRQQPLLAHPLHPGRRQADRTTCQGTGRHLLRLRVQHPGRQQQAAPLRARLLLPSPLQP